MNNAMNFPSQRQAPGDPEAEWSHRNFGDQNFQEKRGFFAWWYRLTAPPDPPPGSTFRQRDNARRGRIASAIMLFLGTILLLVFPIGILTPNHTIAIVAVTVWTVILISIPLNRRGLVILVGVLIGLSVNVGQYSSVLTSSISPKGLSINDTDILYLLVFAEILIGAILPVNWIFLPVAINILFSIWQLNFAHHDPTLVPAISSLILSRVIQLHVFVTGIIWILGRYAQQAIMRADQAEEVARLHHEIALQAQAAEEQRQELEEGKIEIITTLQRFANGDGNARTTLPANHALWMLAGTINNLLARLQRLRMQEVEMQQRLYPRLQQVAQMEQQKQRAQLLAQEVVDAIRHAERSGQPLRLPELTGTAFEGALTALNGVYMVRRPPFDRRQSTF